MTVWGVPQGGLSDDEIEELMLRETLAGADSLLDFIATTDGYTRPEHLRPLAEAIVDAESRPVRLCISVPRRHGKTETLLHGIARMLIRAPWKRIAYVSYASDFAREKSQRCRDIAELGGVLVRKDARAKGIWLTRAGGGMYAVGVGGQLTGRGVDMLIVDDPHKNRAEADSRAIRERVWRWFTSTGISSVEPGGSVIVCHTRWHEDDLIGRLASEEGWRYINIPAVDDSGRALWPERWPIEELERRRREVGEYDWAALYMGRPRPRGSMLFKDSKIGEYIASEAASPQYWYGRRTVIACDPAATAATHADYSVAVVVAYRVRDGFPELDVLEMWRGQVEVPELCRTLLKLSKGWSGAPIVVESIGGFNAVPQLLKQMDQRARVYAVKCVRGDKFSRAQTVAAAWNDGRVRLPTPRPPWASDMVGELVRFTGISDEHDDVVDALTLAYNHAVEVLSAPRRGVVAVEGVT